MGLYQTKMLLHIEGNHQQSKKATTELEKVFANNMSDILVNIQNIDTAHTTQEQKKKKNYKNPINKRAEDPN